MSLGEDKAEEKVPLAPVHLGESVFASSLLAEASLKKEKRKMASKKQSKKKANKKSNESDSDSDSSSASSASSKASAKSSGSADSSTSGEIKTTKKPKEVSIFLVFKVEIMVFY